MFVHVGTSFERNIYVHIRPVPVTVAYNRFRFTLRDPLFNRSQLVPAAGSVSPLLLHVSRCASLIWLGMALMPSLQSFLSHILHGAWFRSQLPSHSECSVLSSLFENNARLYFHTLYEFLLSAELSFPFFASALGVPPMC